MIAGDARVVQRELSTDGNLEMIADVSDPGCRQEGRKGLTGRSGNQLVVVDFIEEKEISKGPLQADILDVVAQVHERIFSDLVGEHFVAGMAAERGQIAEIALDAKRP